jgi:uncharacterized membrane protein YjgN (DUF898 family)
MTTLAATETVTRQTVDLGAVFKHGWRLFLKDIVHLLLAIVVATALSIVSLGILAGPLYAGLHKMVVERVRDGREPKWDDVFGGLDRFWTYLGAALFLVLVIGLASITIVGGILLATIWLYVFPLMVDRGMRLGEALGASYHMVRKAGFWEHVALVILLMVINSIDGPAALVTAPFTIVTIMVAYYLVDGREDAVEKA